LALIIDELFTLPFDFIGFIVNVITQTAYKTAWENYRRELNTLLIRARRDYEEGRIDRNDLRELKHAIFQEMRLARKVLESRG
jgi:predicted membrane protein